MFFGVLKGSILGPILFNIYVSKLPECIKSQSVQYVIIQKSTTHVDSATCYQPLIQLSPTFETKYSRMDQINFWKTAFKKLKGYGLL